MHNSQNGQTHFKNLAFNAATFLKLDHSETLYIKGLRMLRLILANTKELSYKNYIRAWNPYFDMNLETHQYSGILIKKQ